MNLFNRVGECQEAITQSGTRKPVSSHVKGEALLSHIDLRAVAMGNSFLKQMQEGELQDSLPKKILPSCLSMQNITHTSKCCHIHHFAPSSCLGIDRVGNCTLRGLQVVWPAENRTGCIYSLVAHFGELDGR